MEDNNENNKKSNNQTSNETKSNATQEETKLKQTSSSSSETKEKNEKDTFQDYLAEFKKIVWPSRPEIIKKTTTVVGMSIVIGTIVFGMDSVLSTGYTTALKTVRDDVVDYSNMGETMEFTDEMLQEMLNGITIEGEDGLTLDSSDYTINEDGSISIGGNSTGDSGIEEFTEDGSSVDLDEVEISNTEITDETLEETLEETSDEAELEDVSEEESLEETEE